ncbi:LAFA_0E11276g1_1 [Lachancea sp. 'fantastica']|nr:LAFA_0E11276g1_1 [Lachancea sp. 'fantastica']
MDWAVKSARKKTRFIQGGSRSIVESLNRFNEVLTEGQDAISQACLASSKWLDDELSKIGLTSRPGAISETGKEITEGNKVALEESTPQKSHPHESWQATPGNTSHKIEAQGLPQPEKGDNEFERKHKDNEVIGDVDTSSKAYSRSLKSSPWSPYKSERTTFAPDYVPPQTSSKIAGNFGSNVQNNPSAEETHETKKDQSPTGSNSPSANEAQTAPSPLTKRRNSVLGRDASERVNSLSTGKTERLPLRDRSKRRTDMFIPLPDKDPLIIRSSVNSQVTGKDQSNSASNGHDIATKSTGSNVTSQHDRPPAKTAKPSYTNVFDRLTSTSTASFDKKASSRSPTRELKRQKLIGLAYKESTGSPKEKRSPRVDHTNRSIQETLKNIFDSQIPMLGQMKNANNPNGHGLASSSDTVKRTSLIPKLSGRTAVSPGTVTSNSGHTSVGFYKNGLETSPTFHSGRGRGRAPIVEKLQERNSTVLGLFRELSTNRKRDSRRETLTMDSLGSVPSQRENKRPSEYHPEKLLSKSEKPLGKILPREHKETRETKENTSKQAQDRLTKFQLLPLNGSERQDVKKKLDKRLSEVIRSQKEQNKRSQEKLKRKSNIEEDVKQRKSRIFQDTDPYRGAKSFCAGAEGTDDPHNRPRNTMLYDLNTTDHRQLINGNMDATNTEANAGDTTLPEIDSDSDAEDRSILAPWANSPYLQKQLLAQQDWDPQLIFGPIPPLHTDEVFQNSRLSKLKTRQSISRHNTGV